MLGYKFLCKKFKTDTMSSIDRDAAKVCIGCVVVIFYITLFCRIMVGVGDSNNPEQCRVKSIGDVLVSPMYAIGCNIGKDRFDVRLNGEVGE